MVEKAAFSLEKFITVVLVAVVLVLFYMAWTHVTDAGNLMIIGGMALVVSALFVRTGKFPRITLKKIAYSIAYIGYLFVAIVRSNLDVARRVIQPKIPINPGIVVVKTRLKSPIGRMILANSITLTPGTLSVDVKGDHYYIHWIDVTDMEEEGATEKIVAGFEKYLEVIFG
jgi:multicomponent Na+:H+ antiporter subunit E